MAGQNVPLMLTQGITVTNDSLVHFMPDTTPRAAKKVYLVFLSLSAVWTLGVWGAAGELIHDLRSKSVFFGKKVSLQPYFLLTNSHFEKLCIFRREGKPIALLFGEK